MFDRLETPFWPDLIGPLSEACLALGRLQYALKSTPLYQAWLWRETARASAKIGQNAGYRVSYEQLSQDLAGLPIERAGDGSGLAAAKRIFLTAIRLFREASHPADSIIPSSELLQPLWSGCRAEDDQDGFRGDDKAHGAGAADQIKALVEILVSRARMTGIEPLVTLLQGLRDYRTRHLSPTLVRLALPLAIHQMGLLPKPVPVLLGGRLPLASASSLTGAGLTSWLARALTAFAKEADGASARLDDLTRQHRAWHDLLATSGPRRHSRAPMVLDLLTVTPVISASLVARHLGCTPQGAGLILGHLVDLGVLSVATERSRWKIFLASDLLLPEHHAFREGEVLSANCALPKLDHERIQQMLDGLLGDLDRAMNKTEAVMAATNKARSGS